MWWTRFDSLLLNLNATRCTCTNIGGNAAGRDSGTAYGVFHNSEPNRWIKASATIDHRFLNGDVPYGLVAIAELGHVAEVPTPCADAVIEIASIVAGRSYRRDGLTRDRWALTP